MGGANKDILSIYNNRFTGIYLLMKKSLGKFLIRIGYVEGKAFILYYNAVKGTFRFISTSADHQVVTNRH